MNMMRRAVSQPLNTFAEFWPHYLRAHRHPRTRAIHYCGTVLGVLLVLAATLTGDWRYLVAAPAIGYALAWFAHGVFERNRPATFGHPLWSLYSDFYMLYLWLTGRLEPELQRAAR
jgi:hypothetical protein